MRFGKHYTVEEVRALIPQLRLWLDELNKLRRLASRHDNHAAEQFTAGADLGGPAVNAWLQNLARMKQLLAEFARREIQIKDIERGLLDFPHLMHDREVFLCWEQDEEDIEHWHDLDTGYSGREKL